MQWHVSTHVPRASWEALNLFLHVYQFEKKTKREWLSISWKRKVIFRVRMVGVIVTKYFLRPEYVDEAGVKCLIELFTVPSAFQLRGCTDRSWSESVRCIYFVLYSWSRLKYLCELPKITSFRYFQFSWYCGIDFYRFRWKIGFLQNKI